jgi:hypothetical protein
MSNQSEQKTLFALRVYLIDLKGAGSKFGFYGRTWGF